jgi:hypothetical protein
MGKPDEALTIINSFFAVGEGLGSAILDAEALIMEGDILINRGYTNIAWGYYRLVKPESPLAARALVGQAVCRMLRGEYDSAAVIADSCLRQCPNDHYTYMARCLKADCARKLEDLSSAQEQYDIILSESANKITLADYLTEKLKIIYLLNQLREGEESILSTGDQDLFNEYWALRSETELMLKRAIYTEVIKVDSEFAGFIQEKLNVAKLMEEFTELGNDVLKIEDLALEDRYREMEDRLMDLASMVQIAGYGRLQNLPLYYTITDYEFSRAALDSLYEATTAELEGIEAELLAIGGALDKLDEEIAPGERARMMATVDKIQAWQSALDLRINRNLPKMAPSEGLDLTQWSHIAFHKTLVPGTDFNDLKEKQQRIKDIDNYIEALGKITHQMGIDLKE